MYNGSLIQSFPVTPGEIYLIRGWMRQTGDGTAFAWVRWQHEGKFVDSSSSDSLISVAPNTKPSDWGQFEGVATAPEGASNLVILVSVLRQTSPQDAVWVDDIEAFKIP